LLIDILKKNYDFCVFTFVDALNYAAVKVAVAWINVEQFGIRV